ncbi:MAG: TIR domain-containing protein [Anaerolineales bacterium]|nr:TIR domain-containing protein [Anaerolineales bacterium]
MGRIEKTIFICYRRNDLPWALAIYKDLTSSGYDVFFDFLSINSGDFEEIILGNIKARAHFIVLLTPTALDRCISPGDWVRLEIETAMDTKRNIIPLMFEGFDFRDVSLKKSVHGKVSDLKRYNGLRMPFEYFDEAMIRLRERFLNIQLESVIHPLSSEVKLATIEQKKATENVLAKINAFPLAENANILLEQKEQDANVLQQRNVKKPRGRLLKGVTISISTPLGETFVTVNEDEHEQPFEVFISTSKAGLDTSAHSEALGRLITLILRKSEDNTEPLELLQEVIRQLSGIGGGGGLLGFGPNRVRSLPDGVSKALQEYLQNKEKRLE